MIRLPSQTYFLTEDSPATPLLEELVKFGPRKITIVFLDRALHRSALRHLRDDGRWPASTKLEILFADPFRWRGVVSDRYDLVLIRRELARTISDNRYYSLPFYGGLSGALADGGFVCFSVPYEENRVNRHTLLNLKLIKNTLDACFRNVSCLAASDFWFFAGPGAPSLDRKQALSGLRELGARPRFLN